MADFSVFIQLFNPSENPRIGIELFRGGGDNTVNGYVPIEIKPFTSITKVQGTVMG